MNIARRDFLSLVGKSAGILAAAVALPKISWAKWNEKAFLSTDLQKAIDLKYPGLAVVESDKIKMKAPAIAENGAVVPVSVKTSLPNVTSISLFIENNPSPLAASFALGPANIADVSVRVRMGATSNIIAMVESNGKLHKVQQEVKVTIGGCAVNFN